MPFHPGDRIDYLCDTCGHTVHTRAVCRGKVGPVVKCTKCGDCAQRIAATDTAAEASHEWYSVMPSPKMSERLWLRAARTETAA